MSNCCNKPSVNWCLLYLVYVPQTKEIDAEDEIILWGMEDSEKSSITLEVEVKYRKGPSTENN